MTGKDAVQGGININAWRQRIRDDTFANYHTQMGLALQGAGDVTAAIAAFERTLAIMPDDALAHFGLVAALQQINRTAEAEAAHRKALECAPDYQVQALRTQAYEQITAEHLAEASNTVSQLVQLQPDSWEGQDLLAYIRLAEGQWPVTAAPPNQQVNCERLSALGYPYIRLAWRFARKQQAPETMQAFEQALHFNPSLSHHISNVGMIYWMVGQVERLVVVLEALTRRVEDDPHIWNWLGQMLLALGHMGKATEAFRRALAIDEQSAAALPAFGNLLQACGRLEEAADWYDRAKRLRADDIWLLSGQALLELQLGSPTRAMELQLEVLRLYPRARDLSWLGTNIALVEQGNGLADAARASHRRAIATEPHLVKFHASLRPWAMNDLMSVYKALDFNWVDPNHVTTIVDRL